MLLPRIIPSLLIQNGSLVKTTYFQSPKYVGDPINAVRIFNEKEADELVVFDIDATANASEPNYSLIKKIAAECRMPLCYGGGIKTAAQAKKIIGLGVEKIALSSGAIQCPNLVSEISSELGRQSVVVVLDVKRIADDNYGIFINNGKTPINNSPAEMAQYFESLGAGEIIINSIDKDGAMTGFDINLATIIRDKIRIPITMLGGAGSLDHIGDLIGSCGIIGAAAGSLFVFRGKYRAVLISYPDSKARYELIKNSLSDMLD